MSVKCRFTYMSVGKSHADGLDSLSDSFDQLTLEGVGLAISYITKPGA